MNQCFLRFDNFFLKANQVQPDERSLDNEFIIVVWELYSLRIKIRAAGTFRDFKQIKNDLNFRIMFGSDQLINNHKKLKFSIIFCSYYCIIVLQFTIIYIKIQFQMATFESASNVIENYQSEISYVRPLGSKKRKFQSIPDDYYPPTNKDIIIGTIALLFIIVAFLGIMIGFLYWVFMSTTEIFIDIWVAIFLAYIMLIIIALYFGGRIKRTKEREMMRDKLKEEKLGKQKQIEMQQRNEKFI